MFNPPARDVALDGFPLGNIHSSGGKADRYGWPPLSSIKLVDKSIAFWRFLITNNPTQRWEVGTVEKALKLGSILAPESGAYTVEAL
jgi:hypothetical protein